MPLPPAIRERAMVALSMLVVLEGAAKGEGFDVHELREAIELLQDWIDAK